MRQWIHFHILFLKEASVTLNNNNHVIFPPQQADLFYSMNQLEIGHARLIHLTNKEITSGLQTTSRKPSETKQRIHLLSYLHIQPRCKPPSPAILSLSRTAYGDEFVTSVTSLLMLSPLGLVFADIMTPRSSVDAELTHQ